MTELYTDFAPRPDRLFGLPHARDEARVRVLPVDAPAGLLASSHRVGLHDVELGEPWRLGLFMDESGEVDAVEDWTRARLADGRIPVVLGGDRSVALGAIRAANHRDAGMGVLCIAARPGLQGGPEARAEAVFHHVRALPDIGAIVQVGIRELSKLEKDRIRTDAGLHVWTDPSLANGLAQGTPYISLVRRMIEPLPERVWVSVAGDGLDPRLCPHTPDPVPGGLGWRETTVLLAAVVRSGRRIMGFDLCSFGGVEPDTRIAARLLYKLAGWAMVSQQTADATEL